MGDYLKLAAEAFEKGDVEETLKYVESVLVDGTNLDALLLRAKVNYQKQYWGNSLNDLNKVLDIQPQNEVALNYKRMILNILSYWNKDNYNP